MVRRQPVAAPPTPPSAAPPMKDSLYRSMASGLNNSALGSTAMRPNWFMPSWKVSPKPSDAPVFTPVAAPRAASPLTPWMLSREAIPDFMRRPRASAPSSPRAFAAAYGTPRAAAAARSVCPACSRWLARTSPTADGYVAAAPAARAAFVPSPKARPATPPTAASPR